MNRRRGVDEVYEGEEMRKGIHRGRRCKGGRCVGCRVGVAGLSSEDGKRERILSRLISPSMLPPFGWKDGGLARRRE